jgi:hypothetical protein
LITAYNTVGDGTTIYEGILNVFVFVDFIFYGLTILNYDSKKEEFLIPKTIIRYEVVPNVT